MSKRRGHGDGSIYKSGSRWIAAITVTSANGRQVRRRRSARTYAEARSILAALDREHREGLAPDRRTVADHARWWLSTVLPARDCGALTADHYRTMIEGHVIPGLGHYRLTELRPEHVDAWLAERSQLSRSYLSRLRSTLAQLLAEAERRSLVGRNVARLAVCPKGNAPTPRRSLTRDEVRALLRAAEGDRLGALVAVGVTLGLRPGELAGLRWCDLDLDGDPPTLAVTGSIKRTPAGGLYRGSVKRSTAGERTLALPARLVEALRSHRARQAEERLAAGSLWQDEGLIFTTTLGTALDPSNLRDRFARIADAAGIAEGFPYLLRHTAASLALDAGSSIEEVADLLGDDPATLLRHYRHRVRPVVETALRVASNEL